MINWNIFSHWFLHLLIDFQFSFLLDPPIFSYCSSTSSFLKGFHTDPVMIMFFSRCRKDDSISSKSYLFFIFLLHAWVCRLRVKHLLYLSEDFIEHACVCASLNHMFWSCIERIFVIIVFTWCPSSFVWQITNPETFEQKKPKDRRHWFRRIENVWASNVFLYEFCSSIVDIMGKTNFIISE